MAFIISKKSRLWGQERRLYYLVESYREGDKVKRKTLLALKEHKSVAELLSHVEQKKARELDRVMQIKGKLDDFLQHGKLPALWLGSPDTLPFRLGKSLERIKASLEQREQEISKIKSFL
ncbi:TPA: hypothetical protein HA242_07000 [Candidatus Woesearchaeota archaeon]|nr:hypothetical protein [Candidatus Woesearchaeota archaeon]